MTQDCKLAQLCDQLDMKLQKISEIETNTLKSLHERIERLEEEMTYLRIMLRTDEKGQFRHNIRNHLSNQSTRFLLLQRNILLVKRNTTIREILTEQVITELLVSRGILHSKEEKQLELFPSFFD